jgi:single-stranded-DNA-specific exonuclease
VQLKVLGGKHLKLVVSPEQCDLTVDAIAFNAAPQREVLGDSNRIRLVYRLDINEYRGQRSLQLMVDHFAPA